MKMTAADNLDFYLSNQPGSAERGAASIAEGKCSYCGAKFLMGADAAIVNDEVNDDRWCHDGHIRRPPKQISFLLCFACIDDWDYDPAEEDPKPRVWKWGRC
jgi:hypothetical protein